MKQLQSSINPGDESTKPHRIVLRNLGFDNKPKFVTHLETLTAENKGGAKIWHHDGYHHGHYNNEINLLGALNDYEARCQEAGVEPNLEAQLIDQ